jgi:hypothetical protein
MLGSPLGSEQPAAGADAATAAAAADADLSAKEKEVYDSNKLSITDVTNDTSYTIRDGRGAIVTENEFIRRYHQVIGDELNGYMRNHALGARIGWTTIVSLGLVMVIGGLGLAVSDAGRGQCTTPMASGTTTGPPQCGMSGLGVAGAVGAGAGVLGMVMGAVPVFNAYGRASYDGPPAEHLLSQQDAGAYITRYNHGLIKTVRDDEKNFDSSAPPPVPSGRITLAPVVSPAFTGIVGQF